MDNLENKKEIIHLKNNTCVNTYLTFLQDVISRMGTNSSNIKALTAVIYTIVITVFITIGKLQQFWWVCIFISIIGMIMDSYYLAFEKMYRKKYNKIVQNLNNRILDEIQVFNMSPKNTELKYEVFAEMLDSIKSFSIIGFYLIFFLISIFFKFI